MDKIIAFARRKGDEALARFDRGEWAEGIPRARAALDLFARVGSISHLDAAPLYRGICNALVAQRRFCEAHEVYCEHAMEVGDDTVKGELLQTWLAHTNLPTIGDLVQLSSKSSMAVSGHGQLLVGVVVAFPGSHVEPESDASVGADATDIPARCRVRLQGVAGEGDSDMPALSNTAFSLLQESQAGSCAAQHQLREEEIVEVDTSDLTLLSLRLTEEQRERWVQLRESRRELFGERMKVENEKRWQKLFGGCAARHNGVIGADAAAGAADLGLPLEQSFVATLHSMISDWLKLLAKQKVEPIHGAETCDLVVDLLGCRPALELADPVTQISRVLLTFSASIIRSLTVRMCGPDVDSMPWTRDIEVADGQQLLLELRPGLYHDAFPEGGADIVIAMNSGIGVPQYKAQWSPTLDLFARYPHRFLLAVTTYSPGELLQEEQLLRRRYAEQLEIETAEQLDALVSNLVGPPPWTLPHDVHIPCTETILRRGDVVEPSYVAVGPARTQSGRKKFHDGQGSCVGPLSGHLVRSIVHGPWCFNILRADALVYVGPNSTPGRSRNYGKLLLCIGRNEKSRDEGSFCKGQCI